MAVARIPADSNLEMRQDMVVAMEDTAEVWEASQDTVEAHQNAEVLWASLSIVALDGMAVPL